MARCNGITQAGTRCKGIPIDDSSLCYAHYPENAEDRRRAGRKGGKRGGRGRPLAELQLIKESLSELASDVLDGEVDKSKAAVASQVYNVLLRAVSVELKVREQQELEERLGALEAVLNQKDARGWR